MVKAVLFDLDGTLLNRDASVKAFIHNQYERFQAYLSSIPKQEYANLFIHLDDRGYVWKDKVYQQIIEKYSLAGITWEALLADYIHHFCEDCVAFPNLVPMLEELRERGYRLGIISNGKGSFQYNNVKALGIEDLFDLVLISEWEGVKKPNPSIFTKALQELNINAEDSVFVGDHPEKDILAANRVGMKTIWKQDQQWSQPEADGVVGDLRELPSLLESL
ncbi:HAD family hydrolase [Pontibacillus yanchengensis]|uniref:L-2-haloalkanoic acid dehalogenase n=1 Tax=Pontibacillus yanchengensis Y32 TaxID=1385514 RepID=A0A0A2TVV3_9BACI|nr:HAD-IIIA family hydrolase [Pontibacillus yanchengensis]KGP73395.1 L-2-haloalkanoic acid dehalogenase [Pontibacillus yanchengensis Y32]